MKKVIKSSISILLVFVMIFGIIPISKNNKTSTNIFSQKAFAANALTQKYKGTCLANMECIDEGHYTGNMGDSRVYKLDGTVFDGYAPYGDRGTELKRNGNIGVNNQTYNDGFEVWIARWNGGDNISWAYRTFKLDGKYNTLCGSTGLIRSYNTTHFDTTAYFYGDGELLYSVRMTQSSYVFDFVINVSGVNELKVMLKDNTKEAGGTSFALYDLYLFNEEYNKIVNSFEKALQISKNDLYIQEHLNFINSEPYFNLLSDYRFEDNLADKDDFNNKIAAAVTWDLIGDIGEMASLKFDDLTLCNNPFSIVLADLITSYTASQTLETACYNEVLNVFDETYDTFMKAIKTSNEWNESLEPKMKIEVKGILTDPNYKIQDKECFDTLKRILKGWNSDEIAEVFNLLNVANDIFDVVDTIGELDSAFTKAVNAYITASAFMNVSLDFKGTLLMVAFEMDKIPSTLFAEAIEQYAGLLDGETAFNYALKNLSGSLAWTSYGLVVQKLMQNTAYQFVSTAFGCDPSAVGIVVFAYNTTYSILNYITALGERADLLYLMEAARYIERGLYTNVKAAAMSLKNNQTQQSAELFDCRWGMLCAIQKYEYSCAVKFASKDSIKTRVLRAYNSNYESTDMKIGTELSAYWENTKCHGNAISFGKICSVECPTNVTVKDSSGNIVLAIEGNDIKNCKEGITVLVGDEHKYFSLPNSDSFLIEIVGTDEGTMDYTVSELKDINTVREVEYKEIPLANGTLYNGMVSNILYEDASKYNLNSEDGNYEYINDSIETDDYSCNNQDWDNDGLSNLQEYKNGTNPLNPDTDGDNVYDCVEIWNNLNPLEPMTDGEADDYTVVYGIPDVSIDASGFVVNETEVTCKISNNTDGKAMRTLIYLYVGDELVDAGTVNLDANSFVEYKFPREYLVEGMRIVLDEGRITRDSDYSNNEFIYTEATGIAATDSELTVVKGTSIQLEYALTPDSASDILIWQSADKSIVAVDNHGLATAETIGSTTVTATTPTGYSCTYNILVEPFSGAGVTDFDCRFINDNTELEIIDYYGSETSIKIPDSIGGYPVTSIANGAFNGCEIESVLVSAGVANIGQSTFNGALNLKSIEVNEDNAAYCSDAGILYNFDKTVLIRYPSASESAAFAVPDTVETVEENAFNGAVALETVDIPESVTTINSNSFANMNLASVNYAGSERIWNALKISSDSGLSGITVCYGKFTATFICEGETISQTDYKPGDSILIPNNLPEKKYYTFVDWTPAVPETMPECDTDFVAVWELSETTRTVEYYVDGDLYWSDYRYAGEEVAVPETPTKEGYTFVKWSPDVAETMPDENLTYEAIWDIDVHQVTFNVDGETHHSYECAYSDAVTIPDSPSKEGYNFVGWTPAVPETMPDTDLEFIAVFEAITYTATFTVGETVVGTDEFTVEDTELDISVVEQREGYEYVCDDYVISANDITVNGNYVPIVYNATFVADGKTVSSIQFDIENMTVNEPDVPSKAGYNGSWESYEIQLADFTVNAVYTPITYVATFMKDGEIIGTDEFTVEDSSLDYPVVAEKENYNWVWDEHEIVAGNITVSGKYVPISYTITFIADEKTVGTAQFNVENQTVSEPDVPDKVGYTGAWEKYEMQLTDFTVKAIYTPIIYTATFTTNGEYIGEDKFTVEDSSLDYPDIRYRNHYNWVWESHKIEARDITVDGKYVPIVYTIKFVSNGKVVKTQTFTVETSDSVVAPNTSLPAKKGYTVGWEDYKGKICNLTVNEIYKPISYKLSFCYEDKVVATRWYTIEDTVDQISLPALPNESGYMFEWPEFELEYKDSYVYAVKTPIEYIARFIADGELVEAQTFTVETEKLNEPQIPQKAGYIAGWSYYEIKAKDIDINAKYSLPNVFLPSVYTVDINDSFLLLPSDNFDSTEKVWSSSDSSVATVSRGGRVTAVGKGECKITVTCFGKDSMGNDIKATGHTIVKVKDNPKSGDFKQNFRERFNEFFEITLHDLLYNFREFMILLLRSAY
ncbi:MAG: InlB B-repeat-containing protein [Monoglobaceae bacterium]